MRRYVLAGARISSRLGNAPEGDIFIAFLSRASSHATGNRLGMLAAALYAPFSRGTVRLDRGNPQGPPTVDFNLLADPRDTSRMIEAARFARALLRDPEVVAVTIKANIGTYIFEAQYQQRPVPPGGALIKWAGFQTYDQVPERRGALAASTSWAPCMCSTSLSEFQ